MTARVVGLARVHITVGQPVPMGASFLRSGRRAFLRQVVILWAAGLIGAVGMLPLFFHLNAANLEKAAAKGLSGPLLAALLVVQIGVLLAITVPVGLWAASRLDLRAPLSEAVATGGNPREAVRSFLGTAVVAGAVTGVVLWGLSVFVFYPVMPGEAAAIQRGITWQGLPATLYGGITEELGSRLFLLSVLGLGARRLLTATADGLPAAPFWVTRPAARGGRRVGGSRCGRISVGGCGVSAGREAAPSPSPRSGRHIHSDSQPTVRQVMGAIRARGTHAPLACAMQSHCAACTRWDQSPMGWPSGLP